MGGILSIKKLSSLVINRIAAGEVIERPANVLKELVENAIDAGASKISAEIQCGGRTLVSVTDNGSGMSKEDLEVCMTRNATSKLIDENLIDINTLGFRGEGLASICSVSRVTISSSLQNSDHGWQIQCNGGSEIKISPCAPVLGTRVDVRDLFFITPNRLKFLKTERSEYKYIIDIFNRLALCYPEKHFILVNDGKKVIDYIPTNRSDMDKNLYRISDIKSLSAIKEEPIHIKKDSLYLSLRGYLALCNHSNSKLIHILVNKRPIRDIGIISTIRNSCQSYSNYPAAVLYIKVPCDKLDVNVHPTKSEIRFQDSTFINRSISSAIEYALNPINKSQYKKHTNNKSNIFSFALENSNSIHKKSDNSDLSALNDINSDELKLEKMQKPNGSVPYNNYYFFQKNESGHKDDFKDKGADCVDNLKHDFCKSNSDVDSREIKSCETKSNIINSDVGNNEIDFSGVENVPSQHKNENDIKLNTECDHNTLAVKKSLYDCEVNQNVSFHIKSNSDKSNSKNIKGMENNNSHCDLVYNFFDKYLLVVFDKKDPYLINVSVLRECFVRFRLEDNQISFLQKPYVIDLKESDFSSIMCNIKSFKNIGFFFERFGFNAVMLKSVPSSIYRINSFDAQKILIELSNLLFNDCDLSLVYGVISSYVCENFDVMLNVAIGSCKKYISADGRKMCVSVNSDVLSNFFITV